MKFNKSALIMVFGALSLLFIVSGAFSMACPYVSDGGWIFNLIGCDDSSCTGDPGSSPYGGVNLGTTCHYMGYVYGVQVFRDYSCGSVNYC